MSEHWQPFDTEGRRKYLIIDEQLAMMTAAQEAPLEDWALTMMLLLTGCRLSEALALKLHHIDEHARYVVFAPSSGGGCISARCRCRRMFIRWCGARWSWPGARRTASSGRIRAPRRGGGLSASCAQ